MGLADRLWQTVRVQANHWLRPSPDPEQALEQALQALQADLVQLRQSLAQAIAQQKRTERHCQHFHDHGHQWQQRAVQAVKQGKEDLARSALVHSIAYRETAQTLQEQLTQQVGMIGQMRELMVTVERKLAALRVQKDLFVVRLRSAQVSQQTLNRFSQFNPDTFHQALATLEDQVLQLEAQSQAMLTVTIDDLDQQFAALERSQVVDTELSDLKAQQKAQQGVTPGGNARV